MRFIASLFVMLALSGATIADDSIVIVLDTSGSMGDYMRTAKKSRMEVAQDALSDVLSKVPETTKVGILTFDGWIYELGKVDRAKIEQAIRQTRPGGGTPLYEHMRAAATKLLEERKSQLNVGSYKLLVISDGAAGDDHLNREGVFSDGTPKPGVLADILSRNIVVDTIALDMDEDHPLKNEINGSYMKGDDPASLTKAVSQAVAEVGFVTGQDTSEETFADITDLPVDAVKPILQGLTTFPNHPIGEKPPVAVVRDDGTVAYESDPANEPVPELGEESGGFGFIFAILGIIIGVLAMAVLVIVISSNSRGYY